MSELSRLAKPYFLSLEQASHNPEAAQTAFLTAALAASRDSAAGKLWGFAALKGPADYLETVPVATYPDLRPGLDACIAGQPDLCAGPIVHVERTSGSTCRQKRIPHTAMGLSGFHAAIFPWLYDVGCNYPGSLDGPMYWSASPCLDETEFADVAYLEPMAHLLPALAAVPYAVSRLTDMDEWRYWTAFFLAAQARLSFISVWSPTFLFPLFEAIATNREAFAAILRGDRPVRIPGPLAESLPATDPQRARDIECHGASPRALWPQLRLISCWADGSSRRYAAELAARYPGIPVQPKGLLATEAAMSTPITAAPAPVLALNSAFFELHRPDGSIALPWQMEEGDQGVLVVTTRSGLWRYRTGDSVRVCGFWNRTPCIRFLGREGVVTDLCGEKLDEPLVMGGLPQRSAAFLAPGQQRGYLLFLESGQLTEAEALACARLMESHLCASYHYAHARQLGQLEAVAPVRISGLLDAAMTRIAQRSGSALGTVKPPVLDRDRHWLGFFEGQGRVCDT